MFIVLVVPAVLVPPAPLPLSSPLRVSSHFGKDKIFFTAILTISSDAKQARDLVSVLTESKQKIDPRLAEMARYGGGGGGRGGYGRGRGGGRGGNYSIPDFIICHI